MAEIETSIKIRKKQLKIFAIIFAFFMAIILVFCFMSGEEKKPEEKEKMKADPTVYDVTRAVDDKSYWLFDSERKLAEQAKKQDTLLKEIEEIRGSIQHNLVEEQKSDKEQEIETLKNRITELEEKLLQKTELDQWHSSSNPAEEPLHAIARVKPSRNEYLPENEYNQHVMPFSNVAMGGIFSETIALETQAENDKHIDVYIPANAYASAVLLNGADVSAGITSQANPQPLTLRITDNGSLPNHMVSQLKECRVSVAAHGDLSSERVFMRLENLTCVEQDGHTIETDVEGYVVGKDGKNGIRGKMAIRDGEMLKRGFMGGFLSGLGKSTAQTLGSTSISPLGAINTLQGAEIVKSAGAEGVGNAFELLARYNIQRAEQYQPVIQISGGESVHIVFHRGSKLGEKRMKKEEPRQPTEKTNMLFGEQP